MKAFADMHHAGLYNALRLTLEDRLGIDLYRPIGLEWFYEGYWKIAEPYNNDINTVKQYLEIGSIPEDGTNSLNSLKHICEKGVHHIYEEMHGYYQKAITLEKFKQLDIDFVIASIPAHVKIYKRLIKETGKNAKIIYHIGNIGWHKDIPWSDVDNVIASVKEFPVPAGKNVCFVKQEFPVHIFQKEQPTENIIASFVNCLPNKERFLELEALLPEYKFLSYGIDCRDGIKHYIADIADVITRCKFGYHNKPHGDGFGHVIFNWLAAGKPVIVNLSDYKDKLAGDLLVDMETCISLNSRSGNELAGIVRELNEDDYQRMCSNVKKKFSEHVDFEADAKKIGDFLNALS